MSAGECLLTLLVSLIVFGPKKLPMLACHLGQIIRTLNIFKQRLCRIWQTYLSEQRLQENTEKAHQADTLYQQKNKSIVRHD